MTIIDKLILLYNYNYKDLIDRPENDLQHLSNYHESSNEEEYDQMTTIDILVNCFNYDRVDLELCSGDELEDMLTGLSEFGEDYCAWHPNETRDEYMSHEDW